MAHYVLTICLCYLSAGVIISAISVRSVYRDEIGRRSLYFAAPPIPAYKHCLFFLMLTAGLILAWPVYLLDRFSKRKRANDNDLIAAVRGTMGKETSKETVSPVLTKQPPVVAKTRQFRIVHVDNDECVTGSLRDVVDEYFENVTVETFLYGDEAWKTLEHKSPDLLITDMYMPRTNSDKPKMWLTLFSRLSEQKVNYPVVILAKAITINQHRRYARSLFELNLSFLIKPIAPNELAAELSKYIAPTKTIPKSEPVKLAPPPEIPLNAAYYPHRIEFRIGGHQLNHVGNGRLEYRYSPVNDLGYGEPLYIQPSIEQWKQFKADLDTNGVWSWEPEYPNKRGVRDGTYWSLELKIGECSVSSGGNNNYPESDEQADYPADGSFDRFRKAVHSLTEINI